MPPMPMQGGYSPDDFTQWYQSQYQSAPSASMVGRIGATIGAPAGPGGQFSPQQYQQAQGLARQDSPGFFPEFQAPTYEQGPAFNPGPAFDPGAAYQSAPMYQTPEAFNYADFQAPTAESVQNDPGYQFALQQGTAGIMGNKAAAGLARTGGTLKELMNYGQQSATQFYGDAYNRQANTYGMNRANAADAYATNYNIGRTAWQDREGAQRDAYGLNLGARERAYGVNQATSQGAWDRNEQARQGAFDRNYQGSTDQYNARFRGREKEFDDIYQRWATNVNVEAQRELANR